MMTDAATVQTCGCGGKPACRRTSSSRCWAVVIRAISELTMGIVLAATKTAEKHRQRSIEHKAKKAGKRDTVDHDEAETHRKRKAMPLELGPLPCDKVAF